MTITLGQRTFQSLADGPHLLITGGVHGDEFESIAAVRRLVHLFHEHHESIRDIQGRVTLVPVVNESAFLRGHRCAEDGMDLARTCPGRSDGSITEQTACALSQLIRSADYYIDLHTGGTELSVYPLAGYMMHSNTAVLEVQRRMARAFNLPVIWGTAADLDGRSLSVARDAEVPAIYCEYLGSATCSAAGVDTYVDGCLNVMSELGMLDRPKPLDRVQYVVENPSPGSGHMQVCNPSPCNGYFDSVLKPGDRILCGDLLGTVYPLDGGEPQSIRSTQSGIVLVLRTFPKVLAGESVGVILEVH
jgi:predicted deacylase